MEEIIIKENEEKVVPVLWMGKETSLNYDIKLAGIGASVKMLVLLLGKETDKLELRININHQKRDTKSKVIVKGALNDSAFVNFDGLVKIEQSAKGTNAWLGAHILLLSKRARGRAVPSLEISENDIKAGHATTVGRVNDLELFYLMSRGLTEKDAKSLIVQGFLSSILKDFPHNMADKAKEQISYIQ